MALFARVEAVAARWSAEYGPYEPRVIAARIEARRIELGVPVKELLADPVLGIHNKSGWSSKKSGREAFLVPQISRLHVLLRGWTGFPFVSKEDGDLLDALKASIRLAPSRD